MTDIRIESIKLKIVPDDDIDPNIFDCYSAKDIADWKSGKWSFIGIVAECEVSYPLDSTGELKDRRLETLTSGGLYGIDYSYTIENHHIEVANDQLLDLKEHLKVFSVDVSNFEEFAVKAVSNFEEPGV